MVLQVLADAGQVRLHLDAEMAQALAVPNAGLFEDLRRTDGPCAQDHL